MLDFTPDLLFALAIGLITLLLFIVYVARSRSNRSNLLITGVCDSGKTLIFTQLSCGTYKMTHTSMSENKGHILVKNKSIPVVDIPGHERLRTQLLETYAATARAIIFVIDSSTVTKEIKDVAECLYMMLTDPMVNKARVPVLIACNKQDLSFTKAAGVIKTLLERELSTVRKTRSAALEGTYGVTDQRCRLGKSGVDSFEFSQLLPQKVEFVECSAKGGNSDGSEADISAIHEWLSKV